MATKPSSPSSSYERYLPFVWRSLAALGVPERFEGRSQITTWLYGIARNVAYEHIRRRIRERREAGELAQIPSPSVQTPEDETRAAESRRILLEILAQLEPARREVLALVEIEQIAVKDVAEMLGVKENTVWSRLRLARREFQAHVARLHARSEGRQR